MQEEDRLLDEINNLDELEEIDDLDELEMINPLERRDKRNKNVFKLVLLIGIIIFFDGMYKLFEKRTKYS